MTFQEYDERLDESFCGYLDVTSSDTVKGMVVRAYNSVSMHDLRKCTLSLLMQNGGMHACLFSNKFETLLLTESFEDNELLLLPEAIQFLKEYGKTQLCKNESAGTVMDYCDAIHSQVGPIGWNISLRLFDTVVFVSDTSSTDTRLGAYYPEKEFNEYTQFSKHENRRGYLLKSYNQGAMLHMSFVSGKLCVFIDDILLDLFLMRIPITRETLCMMFDFVIGHERMHKKMDNKSGQYAYIDKHWRNVYNESGCDVLEQACNRAALIHVVKQKHKRECTNENENVQ